MRLNDVLSSLCSYDPRNPDNVIDPEEPDYKPEKCCCDNCFYGRTELALEIVRLRQIIENESK